MDAHAENDVRVGGDGRNLFRLGLRIERDADLQAVLACGRDRSLDVVDRLVMERDAVAAGLCDLREVAHRIVDHEVAVQRTVHAVHDRRDRPQHDRAHRDRLDEMPVADVEVEDPHAGPQQDVHLFAELREVGRIDGGLDLDRAHPVLPAHVARLYWVNRAMNSRVNSVRVLGDAISRCAQPPEVFVQASSLAIYGDPGDRWCDEDAPHAHGFSEEVCERWEAVTGDALPAPRRPRRAGDTEVQVVRTVPERVYDSVRGGDFRILESYTRALSSAERLIYLENQFLWSSEIAAILEGKLRDPPSDDFRLVVVLPADPNDGGDDTRGQLADLIECDAGGGQVLACTLFALGELGPSPVYVHAKVGLVDDRWLTLGSANLNEHSLFNDTEMNVVTCDAAFARETRLRLWAEHLQRPLEDISGDPTRVVDELWKPIAEGQDERRRRGDPLTHRLCLLPHVSNRTRRLLGPLQGLLVDG